MSVANLRTGLAAQLVIGTNALHDPETPVTPGYGLEAMSESITHQPVNVSVAGFAGTLMIRSGRSRIIDNGVANGPTAHGLLNTGYARLLWHIFGGYAFSWPGSTNGSATLTFNSAATNNDTVTIEGQVYTFKTALTASTTANEILVAGSAALQASYFAAAVNREVASDGNGSGDAYGSLTPRNADVVAVDNGDATVTVTDRQGRGAAVNSGGASEVATTEILTDASSVWDEATLVGGVNGTDTRRLHTFTLDAQRWYELLATVQMTRVPVSAARFPVTYVGKPISAAFAFDQDGALMITPTWDMLSYATNVVVASASYPGSASFFDSTEIALTIDAVSEPIQSMNFDVQSGQASRGQAGTAARRRHLVNDRPTITGGIGKEFENSSLFTAWLAGTEAALVMTATGSQIPSSASNYQLIVTMPDIQYTEANSNVSDFGPQQNPVSFQVLDDGTNEPITVQYYTDEGFVGDDG